MGHTAPVRSLGGISMAIVISLTMLGAAVPVSAAGTAYEWPELQGGNARTGFNATPSPLNQQTAPALHLRWSFAMGSTTSGEPVAANGLVYFGAQDGNLRAVDTAGNLVWTAFVGTSTITCENGPETVGIGGSPAVTNGPGSTLYVGGGDGYMYALDALTGATLWRTQLTVPSTGGYLWSSPAVFGGSVYEGLASFGDCPLVRGGLVQLNASTGALQNVRWTVPVGCRGGTIWSSPAIDEARGIVYVATGNAGSCGGPELGSTAIVALRASDLGLVGFWQVPASALGTDDEDFGATPTLFNATIGGQARDLIGVANKNGIYYVLDRTNVAAGPVWQEPIANGGNDPTAGGGSISPSEFDGTSLYIAGGSITIHGVFCGGTLRSVDPASGQVRWYACVRSPILAPVSGVPGLVVVSVGGSLAVVTSDTLKRMFLFSIPFPNVFWGGTAISEGALYAMSNGGDLYAFGT